MEKNALKEFESCILGVWWNFWRTGSDSKADGTVRIGKREGRDFVHEKPTGAWLQEEDKWDSSDSSECTLRNLLDFIQPLAGSH